jgi:hypothetical protein
MPIEAVSSGERIRRKHKRYIVDGSVTLQGDVGEAFGTLVNLGRGGMLVRSSRVNPQAGEEYKLRFTVRGYDQPMEAGGMVVGGHSGFLAMQFSHAPQDLDTVLHFMEQANYPWASPD